MGGKNFATAMHVQLQQALSSVPAANDFTPEGAAQRRRLYNYVDDVLMAAKKARRAVDDIRDTFAAVRASGGTLSLDKMRLLFPGMDALGQYVDEEGRKPADKHLTRIQEAILPRTTAECASVLGLFSYYREFINGFSQLSSVIDLPKKGNAKYTIEQRREAFDKLKKEFAKVPLLTTWDKEDQLVIQTDASDRGYGFVLLVFRGNIRATDEGYTTADEKLPIRHWSKRWTDAQRAWIIFVRELWGLVAALEVCTAETITVNTPVIVQCDQRALLWINTTKQPHCVRWRNLYLKNHRYIIEYLPGILNVVSDAMSRWFLGPGRPSSTGMARFLIDLANANVFVHAEGELKIWIHCHVTSKSDTADESYAKLLLMLQRKLKWRIKTRNNSSPSTRQCAQSAEHDVIILAPSVEKSTTVLKALLGSDATMRNATTISVLMPADLLRHVRSAGGKVRQRLQQAIKLYYPEVNMVWVVVTSCKDASTKCIGVDEASTGDIDEDGKIISNDIKLISANCMIAVCDEAESVIQAMTTMVDWSTTKLQEAQAAMSVRERQALTKVEHAQVIDGVYFFVPKGEEAARRLYVPEAIRAELCRFLHIRVGHLGEVNFAAEIKRRFWWNGWKNDSRVAVQACVTCALTKARKSLANAPCHSRDVWRRHQRVHYDIFGPHTADKWGYRYVLVMVDAFDGYVRLYALRTKSAVEVANVVVTKAIFPSIMDELQSDDDPVFNGTVLGIVCRRLGIKRIVAAPHSQWMNGTAERVMQLLASFMRAMIPKDREIFSELLDQVAYVKNSMPNRRTGVAPLDFYCAGERRSVADALAEGADRKAAIKNHKRAKKDKTDGDVVVESMDRAVRMRKQLMAAIEQANEIRRQRQTRFEADRMKKEYKIGDKVVIYCASQQVGTSKKFLMQYRGPFEVTGKEASNIYNVRSLVGGFKQNRRASWQNMSMFRGTQADVTRYLREQRELAGAWLQSDADESLMKTIQTGDLVALADPDEGGRESSNFWLAKVTGLHKRDYTIDVQYYATVDDSDHQFLPAWVSRGNDLTLSDKRPRAHSPWRGERQRLADVYVVGVELTKDGKLDAESRRLLSGLKAAPMPKSE